MHVVIERANWNIKKRIEADKSKQKQKNLDKR